MKKFTHARLCYTGAGATLTAAVAWCLTLTANSDVTTTSSAVPAEQSAQLPNTAVSVTSSTIPGTTASPAPFALSSTETRTAPNPLPDADYVHEGLAIADQLKAAFAHVTPDQIPSGILLERSPAPFTENVLPPTARTTHQRWISVSLTTR